MNSKWRQRAPVKINNRSMAAQIFGKEQSNRPVDMTAFKTLNGFTPIFTPWNGELWDADTARSCIDAIARNAAKLNGKHIRINENGSRNELTNAGRIQEVLALRPNKYMSSYDFLYKMVAQAEENNNAFAYIHWQGNYLEGIYPINYSNIELTEYEGEVYCVFTFRSAPRMCVPYSDVIHLRRNFNKDDFFGDSGQEVLKSPLSLIHTMNQGISNAIKASAALRGIMIFKGVVRPEDMEQARQQFVNNYFTAANNGGIAAVDAKAEFKELSLDPKMADPQAMKIAKEAVFSYYGVNEKIISSTYNEEEWTAFYESVLEPLAIQLSMEFTWKLFSARERGYGNTIYFNASRIQYTKLSTKIQLIKELGFTGVCTINELREIADLPPLPDGDQRLISKNFEDAKGEENGN